MQELRFYIENIISFNVMGEPIVCTPEDAIRTYLNSGLDALVIGNNLIKK